MPASVATSDYQAARFAMGDLAQETSREVSRLLVNAMRFVHRDQTATIALIRRASELLNTNSASREKDVDDHPLAGGLAPWQIKRIKAFISDRLSASITLDEMAQIVRLSTSYFAASFKVSFGTSPHSYVISQRIEFAKHRMLQTDGPLSAIALDCGFSDQAHFSRLFRRSTGSTPRSWRRNSAGASPISSHVGDWGLQ